MRNNFRTKRPCQNGYGIVGLGNSCAVNPVVPSSIPFSKFRLGWGYVSEPLPETECFHVVIRVVVKFSLYHFSRWIISNRVDIVGWLCAD